MIKLSGSNPNPRSLLLLGAVIPLFLAGCASGREPPSGPIGPGDHGDTEIEACTVQSEDEELQRTRTLADMLARVPGVRVMYRGGNLVVRVRNSTSFLAGEDPLVVLDGMVYNGALGAINPYAIDFITVLKNADETAPYGARGANGVILIRTKTGYDEP